MGCDHCKGQREAARNASTLSLVNSLLEIQWSHLKDVN